MAQSVSGTLAIYFVFNLPNYQREREVKLYNSKLYRGFKNPLPPIINFLMNIESFFGACLYDRLWSFFMNENNCYPPL